MMPRNMGSLDRVIRVVVGLALLAGFFLNTTAEWRWLYLLGIVPLMTGLAGTCPMYSILGVNTCARR
ncbi:YgaP family membrane protein [Paracoccus endophyticus]|uniref:YgaP family membrane protein n=1 Tax=Paracoccus endophyticus TaxID=2233774 RepID=UPI0013A6FBEC|nr:DUF2892 domain-containing protein [Paracoccus endophyticus]